MPPLTNIRPLVARFDPRATDNNYTHISVQELQALMCGSYHHGSTIITLTTLTIPDYKKKGCPFKDNIQKLCRVNGTLNWHYEHSVNRQREREGLTPDFASLPRRWGTHLQKTPFISHVTKAGEHKLYLKFKVHVVHNIVYLTIDTGEDIPIGDVEPWLNPKEKNYRQGVQKEILERDYSVSNILSVHYNKKGYLIV